MKEESTVDLLLDVDQSPAPLKGILLSFQHVFAMFGATILVPLILGMPVSVALFASGVGTLIYMTCTGFKVPVYLGSSFAFITAMALAMKEMGGKVDAAQTGVILTGLIYVLVAAGVKVAGTRWIDKLLPAVVIGPMIIVIGLGLAGSAVKNAGFVEGGDWKNALVAVVTFLIAAFINTKGKGFFTGLAETMVFGVEKGRIRLNLITPYSLYRHGYYEEVQTFIPFTDEAKTEILANKDKVYIVPWSETYGVIPSYIKNLVIRKNGQIYHAQEVSPNYLMSLGVSSTYAFDINLFDGEPMEIIAIDASNNKQLVMPIDRKFYEKRGWY